MNIFSGEVSIEYFKYFTMLQISLTTYYIYLIYVKAPVFIERIANE